MIDATARTPYPGTEHGEIEVPLADLLDGGRVVSYPGAANKYFSVRLGDGMLVFAARNYSGLIPINERVTIDVRPRVPIRKANLARLLTVSGVAPVPWDDHTRDYPTDDDPFPQAADLLADALARAATEAHARGLLREYHAREEDTCFPRGRVLVGPTVQRHVARGVRHRVTAAWHERTADTGPNRLVRYALTRLAAGYAGLTGESGRRRARLLAAADLFADARSDGHLGFLRHPQVADPSRLPSTHPHYRPLIRLAVAVVRSQFPTLADDGLAPVPLPTVLLNLEDVFERYVRAVLATGLVGRRVFDGNIGPPAGASRPLFDPPAVKPPARPDVVVRLAAEDVVVLLDAKYKAITGQPDRDDLNQLVAYAAAYRSPRNIIVHPAGTPGLRSLGAVGPATFHAYGFNLDVSDLPGEERLFCDRVASLCPDARQMPASEATASCVPGL